MDARILISDAPLRPEWTYLFERYALLVIGLLCLALVLAVVTRKWS